MLSVSKIVVFLGGKLSSFRKGFRLEVFYGCARPTGSWIDAGLRTAPHGNMANGPAYDLTNPRVVSRLLHWDARWPHLDGVDRRSVHRSLRRETRIEVVRHRPSRFPHSSTGAYLYALQRLFRHQESSLVTAVENVCGLRRVLLRTRAEWVPTCWRASGAPYYKPQLLVGILPVWGRLGAKFWPLKSNSTEHGDGRQPWPADTPPTSARPSRRSALTAALDAGGAE